MSEGRVCHLYLASNLEELNKKVSVEEVHDKRSPKLLVNSASKLIKEAQLADKTRDEERAYLMYMRYFQVVQKIQRHSDYINNKKYYDGLLDPKTTKKVIERAEAILKSLSRRYDFANDAVREEKKEEREKEREREKEGGRKATTTTTGGGGKGTTKTIPPPLAPISNGVSSDGNSRSNSISSSSSSSNGSSSSSDGDKLISCQKLFSLMKEKCSTYLILDSRPRQDFKHSHMTLPNLINVPQEILKPGLTAGKIGSELCEGEQTQWVMQRHNAEYIVLVDWNSEHLPLTSHLQVLSDAMLKWDPDKPYKGTPRLLQGGYELWCFMYPMHSTNPKVVHAGSVITTPSQHTRDSAATNNLSSVTSPMNSSASSAAAATTTVNFSNTSINSVSLNFDYPDLDEAFLTTPSPPTTPQTHHHHTYPHLPRPTPAAVPQVMRTLKPKTLDKAIMDSKNNNNNNNNNNINMPANNTLPPTDVNASPHKLNLGANVNVWEGKETNVALELRRAKQGAGVVPDKVDNSSGPFVPSRSLKPKDLLASLASKKELQQERKLLEESLEIEQDTMRKIEEMEATTTQRETTSDESSKAILQATEHTLKQEIRDLRAKGQQIEEQYRSLQKENEEIWRMVNYVLANRLGSVAIGSNTPSSSSSSTTTTAATTAATNIDMLAERKKQEEEEEKLRQHNEERKRMQEQVDRMRRERKEKEQRMKEHQEKEERAAAAREREAERLRQEERERKARMDMESRTQIQKNKGSGDSYTTKLRGSPRSSPVRGSNLRRCHSAFNLAQQEEEQDQDSTLSSPLMPNFDRTLKPRVTPQRRNINAARQRNFEPKYGSVPQAKTGLKNLGNTCYMNSIIQCLNNTRLFVKYFLDDTYSSDINPNSGSEGEVAEEVGAVVRALWSGQYRSIAMWDLKNVVGRYHRPFCGCDQQDSHEFLLKLMDWLNDDLNKVRGKRLPMKEQDHENVPEYVAADKVLEELRQRDRSIMSALFHGLHRSTIECGTCGHVSLTFEPFSVLSLSFPTNRKCSLRDLLHHYYKETNIEFTCSKCKKRRNCVRKTDIWKLPPVLILHLNRFEHDVLMRKKQNFVDFPMENLDLTKLTCFNNRYTKYDLYGVCNHYGTMDGGHYTAFCRSPINNKTWYKFDDHEVYEHCSVKTSAAYLLFYEATNATLPINSVV